MLGRLGESIGETARKCVDDEQQTNRESRYQRTPKETDEQNERPHEKIPRLRQGRVLDGYQEDATCG
jgi:hypothetical protein